MSRPKSIVETARVCYRSGVYANGQETFLCWDVTVQARSTGSNVAVSMVVARANNWSNSWNWRHDWTMQLQRQNSKKLWDTIGTRTGYLTGNSPSHRTFTNVKKTSYPLRLVVRFKNHYAGDNDPYSVKYYYSSSFYHY